MTVFLGWKLLKKQAFYLQLKAILSVIKVVNSGIVSGFYGYSKQRHKNSKLVIKRAASRPLKRVRENNKKDSVFMQDAEPQISLVIPLFRM